MPVDRRFRTRGSACARRVVVLSLIASPLVAVGCGSGAVNSAVQQSAQAACLAASTNITNPGAKKAADQACRAVGSGNSNQLTQAAIQAARQACLQASLQISDATARSAAKAACPAGK